MMSLSNGETQIEAAINEERSRISKDLHDGISSELNKVTLLSELARIQEDPDEIRRLLHTIGETAREALAYVRTVVWANNSDFDTLDNTAAYLREKSAGVLEAASIEYCFDFPPEIPPMKVTGEFRKQLLLTVSEALNNVITHSGAEYARVVFRIDDRTLHLEIADDGCGMPEVDGQAAFGIGISNMRKRISTLNGRLEICSAPKKGTQLKFSLPLSERASP